MKRMVLILLLPACTDLDENTASSALHNSSLIDTDGSPDLYVRPDILQWEWVVSSIKVVGGSCEQVELGITPGKHPVVKFSVGVANIGDADVVVGNPSDPANSSLFEYAPCHQHYHFRNYALYELVDPATGNTWRSAKQGFCLVDQGKNPSWLGGGPRPPIFHDCDFQGLSYGWTDVYYGDLPGQYFVLDGGDGQAPVPSGQYILRITTNPPFAPTDGEPCPYRDRMGMCHMLYESNYANNTTDQLVRL